MRELIAGCTGWAGLVSCVACASVVDAAAGGWMGPTPSDAEIERAGAFVRLVEQNLPAADDAEGRARSVDAFVDAGRGPVPVYIPAGYTGEDATPLIVLLHGYMNDGDEVEDYVRLAQFVDSYGFLYVTPTGVSDFFGNPFWNATDACCDLFGNGVDDSAYLRGLVELMRDEYNVDPRRIHFAGHSNGGFMSYRMACDHADVVASVASLAGASFDDPGDCVPSEPVHVLQVHGTSDGVIGYGGGSVPFGGPYPSAMETVESWAVYGGCALPGVAGATGLDLTMDIAGADSSELLFVADCEAGGSSRLWTIAGGAHSPVLTQEFRTRVLDFLFAHPKPLVCPADVDGDGAVELPDLLAVLALFGSASGGAADVDGSGVVDLADLLAVLALFGEACA